MTHIIVLFLWLLLTLHVHNLGVTLQVHVSELATAGACRVCALMLSGPIMHDTSAPGAFVFTIIQCLVFQLSAPESVVPAVQSSLIRCCRCHLFRATMPAHIENAADTNSAKSADTSTVQTSRLLSSV